MSGQADLWTNRITIRSASSSREYTVSERVIDGQPSGTWGCSCPGYRTRRACKHLTAMGKTPAGHLNPKTELTPRQAAAVSSSKSFADSAYSHYDTREGFGTAEDWIRAAEGMAGGRYRYRYYREERKQQAPPRDHGRQAPPPRQPRATSSHAEDMRLLGLTSMPEVVKGLVTAMRKRAMIDHPDHGGTNAAFVAMFAAYERLLRWYPKEGS
jgi:hypothetical protein